MRGAGQARRNAVDQFHVHLALAQPLGFLTAATENAGITTLQAHHALALSGVAQHQAMNERLRGRAAAAAFADGNDSRLGAVHQYRFVDQVIDQYHIGFAQGPNGFEGQQFRVAGTCAYQPDFCAHVLFLTR
ncbi:hypothetical protein D3C75_1055080 [compost metagenome]